MTAHPSRRQFLRMVAQGGTAAGLGLGAASVLAQLPGERPNQHPAVKVFNPRMRVPVSLIIDDSTCLVNLNRFAIPQFAEAWGHERYFQHWRAMPHEIPDDFLREFGEWCGEQGVKGKYSVVPFPACVGRLDRVVPGWTRQEINTSIKLVRDLMMPNWDIHPEMVTHTLVIDTRTGGRRRRRRASRRDRRSRCSSTLFCAREARRRTTPRPTVCCGGNTRNRRRQIAIDPGRRELVRRVSGPRAGLSPYDIEYSGEVAINILGLSHPVIR